MNTQDSDTNANENTHADLVREREELRRRLRAIELALEFCPDPAAQGRARRFSGFDQG